MVIITKRSKSIFISVFFCLATLNTFAQVPGVVYNYASSSYSHFENGRFCVFSAHETTPIFAYMTKESSKKRLIGYKNCDGKIITPCIYERDIYLDFGTNGLIPVKKKGQCGYIDFQGNTIIDFKYSSANMFCEGLASVLIPQKGWGFIDKHGKEVIPHQYKDVYGFKSGLAGVQDSNGKWGFIDKNGKKVIPFKYKKIGSFHEGLARVQDSNANWGYINQLGHEIIVPQYNDCSDFHKGIAIVTQKNSGYYIINTKGKRISKPYDKLEIDTENDVIVAELGNKKGLLNLNGTPILPCEFYLLKPNKDDIIISGNKFGQIRIVNSKGESITSYIFDSWCIYKAGLIQGDQNGVWGVIDRFGNEIQPFSLFDHGIIDQDFWKKRKNQLYSAVHIAAERGDTLVQMYLASMYYLGNNDADLEIYRNFSKALSIYKDAAKQGNSRAQYMVGWMYQHGQGTEKDLNLAMEWYAKSKEPDAANQIAEIKKGNINPVPTPVKNLAIIELAGLAAETTEREVTLRAGIKSDSYISDVRVMLNGNVVEPADRGANVVKNDGNDRTIIRKLILREGSNTIKVIAKNDGGEATAERTIVYRVKNLPILEWRNDIVSVGSSSYHLQLGVRTKSGIVSRMVMLNGKRIDEADRGANSVRNDGYDMVIDRYLMLSEGSNVIKVSVTNAEGTATAERLVTYTKPTPTERRIALVIGNATYNNPCFPNLRNPLNDAKAMYNKFKTLGFDLMPILLNAGRTKMWNAIEEFVDSIEKGNYEVALIYYSGHGLSPDGGANYLIPTDASIKYVDEIKRDGLNSQTDLIAKLEKKKCRVKIALLDCCNNCNVPERGVKNAANLGGMAMMRPPHGISILHAAQPRRTAFDGNSSNSPFVEAFLECADKYADEPWQTFITQVTNLVDTKTKGEQIPYPEGQIRGKFFYLNPNHK